jgi:hypothetical protein
MFGINDKTDYSYLGNIDKLNSIVNINIIDENWVTGTLTYRKKHYFFQMQIFRDKSKYGINEGRISRLHIKGNYQTVSYDRGWDLKPLTVDLKKITKIIINSLDN